MSNIHLLSVGRRFGSVQSQVYRANFAQSRRQLLYNARVFFLNKLATLFIFLIGFATGCSPLVPTPVSTPAVQELRITNAGRVDIAGLTVLFPGPTADAEAIRVEFGNVPAGKTTDYRSVPRGVYRYAAYEYGIDGRSVEQPVVDWVGESRMAGVKFTYQIALDPQKQPGNQIQLLQVLVDGP